MNKTPKNMRLYIGIYGRRNAGKSSLLNTFTRQNVSLVSDYAGTTTDPVEKPMELLPLGPVLFIDTAGIDDEGDLGQLRIQRTLQILDRTDIAILVVDHSWSKFEDEIIKSFQLKKIPYIVVLNKIDVAPYTKDILEKVKDIPYTDFSSITKTGIEKLRSLILSNAPAEYIESTPIIGDLIPEQSTVILVVPIDKEAPKGRLILPQVQTIRDLLDHNVKALVVKESELALALSELKNPPALVVTDSQAFDSVSKIVPVDIPLTSFSILFSRAKGDLTTQAIGTLALKKLQPKDRILIAEACSHHPIADDIGRVKIPRLLNKYCGEVQIDICQGHDFPQNLTDYKLVIHCGSCMFNRRETLNRIMYCTQCNVPISNYGLTIAGLLGILERALAPFPEVLEAYNNAKSIRNS